MAKRKSARAASQAASTAAPKTNPQATPKTAPRGAPPVIPQTTHQTTHQAAHQRSQTPRSASPAAPQSRLPPLPSAMRFLPLGLLALLVLTVAVVMAVFFGSSESGVVHYPPSGQQQAACQPGQARPCAVGNCSGTSACLGDGSWGGCTWAHSCEAGSRIPCLRDGCSYAYRECNPCGSGYGECVPISR